MVKRGENVVANAILRGELRSIIARFSGNCEFAFRIVEGDRSGNSEESIEYSITSLRADTAALAWSS
jgi:hypothetical protein